MEKLIYKICPADEWQEAVKKGTYRGSSDDVRDGFIHFSSANQLAGTLSKHFVGQRDLLLISLQSDTLGENLKWEASRAGKLFPHLYGPLDVNLAIKALPIKLGENGHVIPDLEGN